MPGMTRPRGVPEEAFYSKEDNNWQKGDYNPRYKKKKIPSGKWTYWRKDGTLQSIINYDQEGSQEGLTETYHPDGTLASRGEWKSGCRLGHFLFVRSENETDESYSGSYDTWRYEFDSENNWSESNEKWFLKDGTQCTSRGVPLSEAYTLDDTLGAADPDTYLAQAKADKIAKDPLKIKAFWGIENSDLDKLMSITGESHGFAPVTSPREFDGNIWTALLKYSWGNINEELAAVFMGAVQIGHFGDSDGVYYTLFNDKHKRGQSFSNAVYYWSHDTYYVDDIIAQDLSHFAYQAAVAGGAAAERLSPQVATTCWEKLSGKVKVEWHLSAGLEHYNQPQYQPELDGDHLVRGWAIRAQWLLELLRDDENRNMSDVRECFYPDWNKAIDEEGFSWRLESGKEVPQTAIYLLWRHFFFKQNERLAILKETYKAHRAPVVRDLVSILNKVEKGEKEVGGIKDIIALREEFLALDLLPERQEERAKEAAKLAEEKADIVAQIEKQAREIAGSGSLDEKQEGLVELAYANIKNTAAVAAIEKILRPIQYEANEDSKFIWQVVDFVRQTGSTRGNTYCKEEMQDTGYWLGSRQSDSERKQVEMVLPFLATTLFGERQGAEAALLLLPDMARAMVPGTLDARLQKILLQQLAIKDDYNLVRTFSLHVLAVNKIAAVVPPCLDIIEEYFATIDGKNDNDARLETISWDDLLLEVAGALKTLAEEGQAEANPPVSDRKLLLKTRKSLRRLLEHAAKNYYAKLSGLALEALAAWGDLDLTQALERLFGLDDEAKEAALRVIEKYADKMDKEKLRHFACLCFRNPNDNDNAITLLFYRAAMVLVKLEPEHFSDGGELNIKHALEEALELSNYGNEGWQRWHLILADTVQNFEEVDTALVEPLLKSENRAERQAAQKALAARGKSVPQYTELSWPLVLAEEKKAKDSAAATKKISAMLAQETETTFICRMPAAAWLMQEPSECGAIALAKAVDKALEDFVEPGYGQYLPNEIYWLVMALKAHKDFKPAQKAIERVKQFKNSDVSNLLDRGNN